MLSPRSPWKSCKTDCCRCYGARPRPVAERDRAGLSASAASPPLCFSGLPGPGHSEGQGRAPGGRGHALGPAAPHSRSPQSCRKLHLPGFPGARLGRRGERARVGARGVAGGGLSWMSTWRLGTSGGGSPRRSDARLRRGRPRERGEAVEAQVPSPSLACPLAGPREGAEVAPQGKAGYFARRQNSGMLPWWLRR